MAVAVLFAFHADEAPGSVWVASNATATVTSAALFHKCIFRSGSHIARVIRK